MEAVIRLRSCLLISIIFGLFIDSISVGVTHPVEILRLYALQFVGRPYRWGGDDPMAGFDCSGFVQELLSSVGMDPVGDQTAQSLYDYFEHNSRWNEPGMGALVFFGPSLKQITHVGMMVDEYRMIEAGGGGSRTVSEDAAIQQNAYIRIRPIKGRQDLRAILKPRYPITL